jgi:hypothetical protein
LPKQRFPPEFLKRLKAVKSKRPRNVIQHILEHGHITTHELQSVYGYDHPPRAARDVRDQGIPLETFSVPSPVTGRKIAAYRFGDPSTIRDDRIGGRQAFSKKFKVDLIERYGSACAICSGKYEERYLQIDHRVPYEVAGDAPGERLLDHYMLLNGACNRAKSWSCEHCKNWIEIKSAEICRGCYWAHPESYDHVAMRNIRRLDIEWSGEEIKTYERLQEQADSSGTLMPEYVKSILKRLLK